MAKKAAIAQLFGWLLAPITPVRNGNVSTWTFTPPKRTPDTK